MKHLLGVLLWWFLALPALPALAANLYVSDVMVDEGTSDEKAVFVVWLDGNVGVPATVDYATVGCSATSGLDFVATTGSLIFKAGANLQHVVEVPLVADSQPEGLEVFNLVLSNPSGATLARAAGWGQIVDDDTVVSELNPKCDVNGDGRSDIFVEYTRIIGGEPSGAVEVWPTTVPSSSPGGGGSTPFTPESWTPLLVANLTSAVGCEGLWAGDDGSLRLAPEGVVPGSMTSPDPSIALPDLSGGLKLIGSGDFGHTEDADLLIWDEGTGELEVWLLEDGYYVASATPVPSGMARGSGWFPVAVVDLDRDGDGDVVWRTALEGPLAVWRMEGLVRSEVVGFGPATGPIWNWRVVASGDFDGNGSDDLLWQNSSTLKLVYWFFEGTVRTCGTFSSPERLELPGWQTWEVIGPR